MTFPGILMFSAVAAALAVVMHLIVSRYWLAILLSVPASSVLNIAYGGFLLLLRGRTVGSVAFLPKLFILGIVVALPATAIISVLVYVIRRRRKAQVAFVRDPRT